MTLDEKDETRLFEGAALLRRMVRYGLLGEDEKRLDFVLQLTTQKLLERRLQTKVYKQGLAKSIHHARVLIFQRHIRYVPVFDLHVVLANLLLQCGTSACERAIVHGPH